MYRVNKNKNSPTLYNVKTLNAIPLQTNETVVTQRLTALCDQSVSP